MWIFILYNIILLNSKDPVVFSTIEGMKQGGILSHYLFNFYINDLIESKCLLNVGACLGGNYDSTVAYCDDIILISPMEGHMNMLLNNCSKWLEDYDKSLI